jgi:hypothetical protein
MPDAYAEARNLVFLKSGSAADPSKINERSYDDDNPNDHGAYVGTSQK